MNIDDVDTDEIKIPDRQMLRNIFLHQSQLMEKYDPIERRNGAAVPEPPYHIDDRVVQQRLKDLFWRVTEELAESAEEIGNFGFATWRSDYKESPAVRHFMEEIADALHFLVEASIIAGLNPDSLNPGYWETRTQEINPGALVIDSQVELYMWYLVKHIGLTANTLKNKPWKDTAMLTDHAKFINGMEMSWKALALLFGILKLSPDDVYKLYMSKNLVNQFRQRSKY